MEIRRLDPETDIDLYRELWRWQSEYPRALRDAVKVHSVDSFEEFLEQAKGARIHVGIFDSELCAVIGLQWLATGMYEIHLSAKRKTRLEQLIEPCLSIQKTAFEELQCRYWFLFTPEWNRGAILLATAMGFYNDGVSKIVGTTKHRVIKWVRMSQTREDYLRDVGNFSPTTGTIEFRSILPDNDAGSKYAGHRAA